MLAAETWYEIVLPPLVTLAVLVLAVGLAWLARGRLVQLVSQLGVQSVSAFGVDVRFAERQAVRAYAKQDLGPPSENDRATIRDAVSYLAPLAAQSRVLWVDDKPANNQLERSTLLSWEVDVQTARSTDDAIRELKDPDLRFDLVISDWRRTGDTADSPAGLELARRIAQLHLAREPRIVFYHGPVQPDELAERRRRAGEFGAVGTTGSPGELFQWVLLELARVALEAPTQDQRERRRSSPMLSESGGTNTSR